MPANQSNRNYFLLKWLDACGFDIASQLLLVQWMLPVLLLIIVIGDEVYEFIFDDAPLLSRIFIIEVCLFGILGPIVVWLAIGWIREMWLEREQTHKTLRQMYDELNQAQERLHLLHVQRGELLNRLMNVQEEERRHLSREIHDELGQLLTGLSLNLKVCQGALPNGLAQAHRYLDKASALVQQTIEQAHRITVDLRPTILDDAGLLAALHDELHQRLDPLGIQVSLEAQEDMAQLPPDIATVAFRITQEAVTNIIRHAQARQVKVQLSYTQLGLTADIGDDGVGLKANPPAHQANKVSGQPLANVRPHLGIVGMQERATAIGGWLKVVPNQPSGAKVQFWLPAPQPIAGEIYHVPAELHRHEPKRRQPALVEGNR